jgi:Na+/H+ antiporter NhaD/arsenite permease-like protein
MMPALDWLQANAKLFGTPTPSLMYFGSGLLSSVLDNAPTYWSFLTACIQVFAKPSATEHAGVANLLANSSSQLYVVAVTIGSVFFGANTYIGNGPNFMVKSIADQQKVQTPDFLSYIFKYTLPFMAPMLLVVWWLFFR